MPQLEHDGFAEDGLSFPPFPAIAGDQRAAIVSVCHQPLGFEALSPGRDEEEQEQDS